MSGDRFDHVPPILRPRCSAQWAGFVGIVWFQLRCSRRAGHDPRVRHRWLDLLWSQTDG